MTQLLDNLNRETAALDQAGASSIAGILHESDTLLSQLRDLESELESDNCATPNFAASIDKATQLWYKGSIDNLKSYNGQINKFQKNIVHSSKYNVDLDGAYPFPLMLNSYPVKDITPGELDGDSAELQKLENGQQLMKSIVLHLLKTGQGAVVEQLLSSSPEVQEQMDPLMVQKFQQLNEMVDEIRKKHDLTKVLAWLEQKDLQFGVILFKFHMLQFALLLDGNYESYNINATLSAHTYAKTHFPRFFKDYHKEIGPLMTLLLFKSTDDADGAEAQAALKRNVILVYSKHMASSKRAAKEVKFVGDILLCFELLHENDSLFQNLANEFVAEYCSDMELSSESSLFHSVLAGFVNLPNFHKYSKLQRRLSRGSREEASALKHDLPFQLPDTNQFLFKYHPIFICPVSKEQLVPLSATVKVSEEDTRDRKKKHIYVTPTKKLVAMTNPVVVFDHCRHLALKDSVRHLSKGGLEVFKCHYCYKKHKLSDVSDGYFIDL